MYHKYKAVYVSKVRRNGRIWRIRRTRRIYKIGFLYFSVWNLIHPYCIFSTQRRRDTENYIIEKTLFSPYLPYFLFSLCLNIPLCLCFSVFKCFIPQNPIFRPINPLCWKKNTNFLLQINNYYLTLQQFH